MTMEMLNEIMDAMIRGSLIGFLASFWLMGLIAVWRWFLGIVKRFLHWINPKWFNPKTEETDRN